MASFRERVVDRCFQPLVSRRCFVQAALGMIFLSASRAVEGKSVMTMINAPLEFTGNWRNSNLADITAVVSRMREACLSDLIIRSDQQPERIRVDDHESGSPAIWLHSEPATTAWIIVDVGTRDWCKLAYQFGHELGHVVANSWSRTSHPGGPSQWLEEALVEAFALRGLRRLANGWRVRPPFPNDSQYAAAILQYRDHMLQPDLKIAQDQQIAIDMRKWFRAERENLASHPGVDVARAAVPAVLALYEENAQLVEDLSAMNRWAERTHLELEVYLERWEASCLNVGSTGNLPRKLRSLLI
ncbi:hypothetical protein FMGBMHLM_1828 [Methylobacterium aerolatum]|nr:hypothetical protein FMGBMHLM_1828 [Methylobacterium aerolatum]